VRFAFAEVLTMHWMDVWDSISNSLASDIPDSLTVLACHVQEEEQQHDCEEATRVSAQQR
jgi:hypothetical protein